MTQVSPISYDVRECSKTYGDTLLRVIKSVVLGVDEYSYPQAHEVIRGFLGARSPKNIRVSSTSDPELELRIVIAKEWAAGNRDKLIAACVPQAEVTLEVEVECNDVKTIYTGEVVRVFELEESDLFGRGPAKHESLEYEIYLTREAYSKNNSVSIAEFLAEQEQEKKRQEKEAAREAAEPDEDSPAILGTRWE